MKIICLIAVSLSCVFASCSKNLSAKADGKSVNCRCNDGSGCGCSPNGECKCRDGSPCHCNK